MPAFVDNMTFGGRKIAATASEAFAGQTFSSTESTKSSIADMAGIDLGGIHGNYKDWYHLRIQTLVDFVEGEGNTVTFALYHSDTNGTGYAKCMELKVDAESLNSNKNTPFEISLPSAVKRFLVLSVKGNAGETGAVLATVEPKAW